LHLEVNDTLRVDEAHQQVSEFEDELRKTLPDVQQVVTHIEPVGDSTVPAAHRASAADSARVMKVVEEWRSENGASCRPHQMLVQRAGNELSVSLHCEVDGSVAMTDAHVLSEQIEQALRSRLPDLGRVVIHVEPEQNRKACAK
jgi:divalent metal cation (Fe/Co/Zn/Cd) transporter